MTPYMTAYAKTEKFKTRQKQYRKSALGIATRRAYEKSEKSKADKKAWRQSPAGRLARKLYIESPKGKAILATSIKKYRGTPTGKSKIASHRLKARHGIDIGMYTAMLEVQGGKCAICGVTANINEGKHKRFAVDHCHITGTIRGLLCHHCNLILGNAKDDVATLGSAIKYLQRVHDYAQVFIALVTLNDWRGKYVK